MEVRNTVARVGLRGKSKEGAGSTLMPSKP